MKAILAAFSTIVLLCVSLPARPCLNEYAPATTITGDVTMMYEAPDAQLSWILRTAVSSRNKDWAGRRVSLEASVKNAPRDYKLRNDLGVALAHLGRAAEAVKLWEAIEKEKPGLFATAANLGTGYELMGRDQDARRWIATGIKRNPDDHEKSEWVHLRILDAKLALAKEPDWLKTHDVMGLDFGSNLVPAMPIRFPENNQSKATKSRTVIDAIEYQLTERLQFIKPPDAVVGALFTDLGNLYALTENLETAIPMYEQGKKYGVTDAKLIDQRIAHFNLLIKNARLKADQRKKSAASVAR